MFAILRLWMVNITCFGQLCAMWEHICDNGRKERASNSAFSTHTTSWWSVWLMTRVSSNGESVIQSQDESKQSLIWCLCFNSQQTSGTHTHTYKWFQTPHTSSDQINLWKQTNTHCHMLSDKRKIEMVCLGEESRRRLDTFPHHHQQQQLRIPGGICLYGPESLAPCTSMPGLCY